VREKLTQLSSRLARLPDTPERIALAFAIGVFFGFSPFLGLQTLAGISLAFCFRLSRVAVLLGTWVNLPWIVPLYYAAVTELGARMLGQTPPSRMADEVGLAVRQFSLSTDAMTRVVLSLRPMFWPFFTGSLLGAVFLGTVAYWVIVSVLRARRAATAPSCS
jgi:uncharacterized protein (DUF2062 family)